MPAHKPPLAAVALIPVAVALVLTLFAWPNARVAPRHLPIGVAGSGAATAAERLSTQRGAFDIHRYSDEAAARNAIEDREVYGAFVLEPSGPKVLTASAASPAVAQLLNHAAANLSGSEAIVPVEDVAPAPRGAALASSVLPMVIAGMLTGALAAMIASRRSRKAALVLAGSVLAGLTATAIVHSWLDIVGGNWLLNAAALSFTVLAIAATVAGLHHLLGGKGIALAALVMVFIGNPFSAIGTAPELMPDPVRGLGQLLPPGAGGNLLRSTGFFDGATSGTYLIVLTTWTVAGLSLLIVPRRVPPAVADAGNTSPRVLHPTTT